MGGMNRTSSRLLALGLPTLCLLTAATTGGVWAAAKTPAPLKAPAKATPPPVEALLYSTMPSTAAHRPEMAMDGDAGTYFKSAYGMGGGDDFLVLLSRPVPVRSLHITTGDADGQDVLTGGFVETSPDGVHYSKAASFDSAGVADAALAGAPVLAVRIRVGRGQGVPALLVREISIQSAVPISHVERGPGRGFHDTSLAPDVAAWAQRAEAQMEQFWPDTEALLYTDKFIPPNTVNVVYRTGPGVTGVAATGGGQMEVNSAWCRAHPEDTGLTVHETAHVIQAYSGLQPGLARGRHRRLCPLGPVRAGAFHLPDQPPEVHLPRLLPDHGGVPRLVRAALRQRPGDEAESGGPLRDLRQGPVQSVLRQGRGHALDGVRRGLSGGPERRPHAAPRPRGPAPPASRRRAG